MSCGAPTSRVIRHRDHLQLIPDLVESRSSHSLIPSESLYAQTLSY